MVRVQGRFDEVVIGHDRPFVDEKASPDEILLPIRFSADECDDTAPHARVGFRRFERHWSGLLLSAGGLRESHAESRGGRFNPARRSRQTVEGQREQGERDEQSRRLLFYLEKKIVKRNSP